LIVLNNLNSGNHTLTVYNHDGAHFNEVSNFNFYSKTMVFFFWMILLYLVLIGSILFIYYRWNKMRYVQKLKLQEEELKYQKKILEIELKADNELNSQEYEKHILELELQ
jgi:cbb3-type cytochrome oxidase subunit 3